MIILAPVALAAKPTKMIDPGKKRLSENNPSDHHLGSCCRERILLRDHPPIGRMMMPAPR